MHKLLFRSVLIGSFCVGSATFSSTARAARTDADLLRVQVIRLHARLSREAMDAPEIGEAQSAAAKAYAALYQIRENILVDLRKRDDYADLKLALWHQQQQLNGQHEAVPVRIANIIATAGDAMTLRLQINKLETDALEGSPEYVAARDQLNTDVAAEQKAIDDALDHVRTDPQFVALCQQLHAAQGAYSHRTAGHAAS